MRPLLAPIAALLVIAGCGDSTAPLETYHLRALNGRELPAPLQSSGTIDSWTSVMRVAEGSITFHGDGVTEYMRLSCASPLPPGVTCQTSGTGTRRVGVFYPDSGIVRFGDIRGKATFDGDAVTIQYGLPDDRYPMGSSGPSLWRYSR